MPGDDREGTRVAAIGDRNAGEGRRRERRRDAGHHFEGHAGGATRARFFAAAPEHERIAALESHHQVTRARALDQQRVDLVLAGYERLVTALADVDAFGAHRHQVEQFARNE